MTSVRDLSSTLTRVFILIGCASLMSCSVLQSNESRMVETQRTNFLNEVIQALDLEFAQMKGVKIQPHVANQSVVLIGSVEIAEQKARASEIINQLPGVKSLHNELVVGRSMSISTHVGDAILQNRVRLTFLNHKEIPNGKMEVIVRDHKVYLLGRVTQQEATHTINVVEQMSGVREVVPLLEGFPYN